MVHSCSILTAVIAVGVVSSTLAIPVPSDPSSALDIPESDGRLPARTSLDHSTIPFSNMNVEPVSRSVVHDLCSDLPQNPHSRGTPTPRSLPIALPGSSKRTIEMDKAMAFDVRGLNLDDTDRLDCLNSEARSNGLIGQPASVVHPGILKARGNGPSKKSKSSRPIVDRELAYEEYESVDFNWEKFLKETAEGQGIAQRPEKDQLSFKKWLEGHRRSRIRIQEDY